MIKNGTGGGATKIGLTFEEKVDYKADGVDLTKHNLYKFMKAKDIDWSGILSSKLLPDGAWLRPDGVLEVIEKKYQDPTKNGGSVEEKLQTCAYKVMKFRQIADLIGAKDATYTYYLSDYFKNNKEKFRSVFEYIKTVPGCDYKFADVGM